MPFVNQFGNIRTFIITGFGSVTFNNMQATAPVYTREMLKFLPSVGIDIGFVKTAHFRPGSVIVLDKPCFKEMNELKNEVEAWLSGVNFDMEYYGFCGDMGMGYRVTNMQNEYWTLGDGRMIHGSEIAQLLTEELNKMPDGHSALLILPRLPSGRKTFEVHVNPP